MQRGPASLVALLLAVPLASSACSGLHGRPIADVGSQNPQGAREARLLASARRLSVVTPSDPSLVAILDRIDGWGRLSLVGRPDEADLVLEMRRLETVETFGEMRIDEFVGYPFTASVRHRSSGLQVWSTRAVSLPRTDAAGVWAARKVAREFIEYFDREVPLPDRSPVR